MNVSTPLRQFLAVSASVTALTQLHPPTSTVARGLRSPHEWVSRVGPDGAVAALAAAAIWCALVWLCLAIALTVLVALPGALGDCVERVSLVLVPRTLRRVLGIGLGVTMAVGSSSLAHASPPEGADGTPATPAHVQVLPSPRLPQHAVHQLGVAPSMPTAHQSDAPGEGTYQVRPGDSLWAIARRSRPGASDRQIASLWPAWYARNRAAIGPDPDRLAVGLSLQPPDSDHGGAAQ